MVLGERDVLAQRRARRARARTSRPAPTRASTARVAIRCSRSWSRGDRRGSRSSSADTAVDRRRPSCSAEPIALSAERERVRLVERAARARPPARPSAPRRRCRAGSSARSACDAVGGGELRRSGGSVSSISIAARLAASASALRPSDDVGDRRGARACSPARSRSPSGAAELDRLAERRDRRLVAAARLRLDRVRARAARRARPAAARPRGAARARTGRRPRGARRSAPRARRRRGRGAAPPAVSPASSAWWASRELSDLPARPRARAGSRRAGRAGAARAPCSRPPGAPARGGTRRRRTAASSTPAVTHSSTCVGDVREGGVEQPQLGTARARARRRRAAPRAAARAARCAPAPRRARSPGTASPPDASSSVTKNGFPPVSAWMASPSASCGRRELAHRLQRQRRHVDALDRGAPTRGRRAGGAADARRPASSSR